MKKLLIIGIALMSVKMSHACYTYQTVIPKTYNGYPSIGYTSQLNNFLQECHGDVQYALLEAAARGYMHFIDPLLSLGGRINQQDYEGMTALMYAAEYGHLEICKKFIKLGALINLKTKEGFTALMWAAEYGHLDTCTLLLKYGADVYAKDNHGNTAEYYAYYYGHSVVGDLLHRYSLDPLSYALISGIGYGAAALASLLV